MLREWRASLGTSGLALLIISLVSGLATHSIRLFRYPLYITDEGIYMEQAWSVIRQGNLSPYTYFYDHAPGGWLVIAAWVSLLPGEFETFGNAINTGRALMVVVHVATTFLLFEITRRLSGSAVGAFLAAFCINFSPLAIYYQRQVLLDNLMIFWAMLALYLIVKESDRLMTAIGAGVSFGIALVTKENALFFLPALAYLVYRRARETANRRFVKAFWWFTLATPVAAYVLFAQLKGELFPSDFSFDLNSPPSDHVSLLYTVWWQVNRTQNAISENSIFLNLLRSNWTTKDRYLLIGGMIAAIVNFFIWQRAKKPGYLVGALLVFGYMFYLARGSVLLDFYISPILPLLALNVGLMFGHFTVAAKPILRTSLAAVMVVPLLVVPDGYLLAYDNEGDLAFHDLYHLALTPLQERQLTWIRRNVPPDSRIIIDDDIWTALHDEKPYYPLAHSHWKATSDPDVRDNVFAKDGSNIDYVVMSNKMRRAMEVNNTDGREDWILDAIDQHGTRVWNVEKGDVHLEIYQIEK